MNEAEGCRRKEDSVGGMKLNTSWRAVLILWVCQGCSCMMMEISLESGPFSAVTNHSFFSVCLLCVIWGLNLQKDGSIYINTCKGYCCMIFAHSGHKSSLFYLPACKTGVIFCPYSYKKVVEIISFAFMKYMYILTAL